jgi:hypothetical protein
MFRLSSQILPVLLAALAGLPLLCSGASAAAPASFADALALGKVSLNARLRYEGVEQTGLRDADALTLRTRLGFAPAPFHGWKFLVEAENITAADGDSYSQAGLNPGGAGRAVVADPETTELNQLLAAFARGQTTVTLGRQRLVLDNFRFIGDVGWRQNMQTFDALTVQDKSLAKITLTYAYLDQVNRVFSRRHAQGQWDSDSHVFNASYAGWLAGTLTGYAYLLDFDNAAANSCATWGASFAGTRPLNADVKFAYRLEAATQSDYGSSTLNYSAVYLALEAGLTAQAGGLMLGHETMGSDRNVGFKTPLATLHAWNGWADLFLTTPAAGLRDTYVKATANLPANIALTAFYHRFEADAGGAKLGDETDLQLARTFGKYLTGLVKLADFRRDSAAYPDVKKVWAQVEFVY